jgi:hypothetical protein
MSVRPVLLKDLRRTALEIHKQQIGKDSYNRYDALSPRARTFSASKRPRSEDQECPQVPKTPKLDSNLIFSQLNGQENSLKEVKTLFAELEAHNSNSELPADPRFIIMSKILSGMFAAHEQLTSAVLDAVKLNSTSVPKGKAPTNSNSGPSFSQVAARDRPAPAPEVSSDDALRKKIKTVIKDAEKKTLIFDLNLGTSQMMNKESISGKVTTTLGQIVKEGKHDYNIGDAEDVIDDILSCARLEFLGNATKKFFNKRNLNDSRNDKFYSVPVRLDFKDKDTRINAETSLRKICKLKCSIPYPRKLRTLLGELVKDGKKAHPDCFIRTKVNVDKLTVEAHAKTEGGWIDLKLSKPIPLNILDNNPLTPSSSQVSEMEDNEDEVVSLS